MSCRRRRDRVLSGAEFASPATYDFVETVPIVASRGTCMTLEGDGRFSMRTCDGSASQQISVYTDAVAGRSRLRIGDQCIGLEKDSANNGNRVTPEVCDPSDPHQVFVRNEAIQHWESAANRSPTMCLDARGWAAEGVDVSMWVCNASNQNQIWPT